MKNIFHFTIFTVILFLYLVGCNREAAIKGKQAREYFNNQEYNKVIEILETIKPSRRTATVSLLLGKSYSAIFEFDKADHIFMNIFKRYPYLKDSLVTAYISIADRFEKRKRTDLAVKAYRSLLNIESEYNLDNGFYTLGHYYYIRNDLEEAMNFFEKGIDNITEPHILAKVKTELMDIYDTVGMLKKAIEISVDDSSSDIIYRRGKISYKLAKDLFAGKEFDSALVYCKNIIEINSPKTLIDDTYFLMGEIYSACGNYNNALRCYREVVKLDRFRNSEIASLARKKIGVLTQLRKGE